MTTKELITLNNFIKSNKFFSNALKKNLIPNQDIYIQFEMILLYITQNLEILQNISFELYDIFKKIINTQSFIIEENFLMFSNYSYSLEYLTKLVFEIRSYKQQSKPNNIVFLSSYKKSHENENKPFPNCRIIKFEEAKKNRHHFIGNPGIIFERTTKVDEETLPFIEETNKYFKELVEDIVIHTLTNKLSNYPLKYLKILAAYFNLYPFTTYIRGKYNVPFENLSLPQSEIGLRKSTYNNYQVKKIEDYISALDKKERELKAQQIQYEKCTIMDNGYLHRLKQEIVYLSQERINMFLTFYLLKSSSEIYNKNLLEYIAKSFEQGNVEINKFLENPILKMFYISGEKTEFYCAMRLDTFMNLIDTNLLMQSKEPEKKLSLN